MIVGIPQETKRDEYRVSMLPVGVEELVRRGHRVLVEQGAGAALLAHPQAAITRTLVEACPRLPPLP